MTLDQRTPNCPACGRPPDLVLGGGTQAFCTDEHCRVWTWDPTASAEEIMRNATVIDLATGERFEPGEGPPFCVQCGHFHDPDGSHLAAPCPDRRCCIQPPGL